MVTLARGGYAARGIVYLIIGGFAVFSAFGRSETQGSEGALASILASPFGAALLLIVGLGLVAFAGWSVVQALRDTDNHGSGAKGWAIRAGLVGAAVSYGALAAAGHRHGVRPARAGGRPSGGGLRQRMSGASGGSSPTPCRPFAAVGVLTCQGRAGIVQKYFRCGERRDAVGSPLGVRPDRRGWCS
jgi:hypothetical protein